jgi:hypothetical protein
MSHHTWAMLGTPVATSTDTPTGEFAFLNDPLALLSDDEQRDLRDELADLTRLRREAESEGAVLRLS